MPTVCTSEKTPCTQYYILKSDLHICSMNSLLYNNALMLKPKEGWVLLLNDPPVAAAHTQRTCGSGQQAL